MSAESREVSAATRNMMRFCLPSPFSREVADNLLSHFSQDEDIELLDYAMIMELEGYSGNVSTFTSMRECQKTQVALSVLQAEMQAAVVRAVSEGKGDEELTRIGEEYSRKMQLLFN
jgi:hypothetical protein